jgi:hypothetical protein
VSGCKVLGSVTFGEKVSLRVSLGWEFQYSEVGQRRCVGISRVDDLFFGCVEWVLYLSESLIFVRAIRV